MHNLTLAFPFGRFGDRVNLQCEHIGAVQGRFHGSTLVSFEAAHRRADPISKELCARVIQHLERASPIDTEEELISHRIEVRDLASNDGCFAGGERRQLLGRGGCGLSSLSMDGGTRSGVGGLSMRVATQRRTSA